VARALYRTMLRIRRFEETASRLFADGRLPGFLHLSIGQEAVAAGVCAGLDDGDVIAANHRSHGHCLAKGADPNRMMAELFGREEGYCRGVGGSMHIADLDRGILGANGIVGASLLIATGAAFAFQVRREARVAVAFFGDGAANEGAFHEGLNLAALWRLPVLYVCENNGYGEMTPESVHRAGPGIAARGAGYGVTGHVVDGGDALAVYAAVRATVARCRAGAGPALLEARTHRWHGHFEGDRQPYRPPSELEAIRQHDPISRLADRMRREGWADAVWLDAAAEAAGAEMAAAVEFGARGTAPRMDGMVAQVYGRAEPA
jgi:TPP-dependent pyruvate/acetoin dehydrogenase alpha subunit